MICMFSLNFLKQGICWVLKKFIMNGKRDYLNQLKNTYPYEDELPTQEYDKSKLKHGHRVDNSNAKLIMKDLHVKTHFKGASMFALKGDDNYSIANKSIVNKSNYGDGGQGEQGNCYGGNGYGGNGYGGKKHEKKSIEESFMIDEEYIDYLKFNEQKLLKNKVSSVQLNSY